ncbi:TRAP transporter small permease [Mycolicibacterium goodii]|uniref:C4-dicarboxylate ABC transporter permease n=1 Tax=Mycolicibacterium goodii TaxID=134601 RepID=A0A0K0XFF6_MYCGD|nr:C4-dicarboxylate ABC transporter permease [Mycolicibacterium goodii]
MTILNQIWRGLDTVFEALVLLCLSAVLLVVLWQVWDRQVLGSTPGWTEETARILMVWIGFLMTALGFREGAHIALTFVVDRVPPPARRIVEWLTPLLSLLFGVYLIYQGIQFAAATRFATLPGTGLPRSVLYVVLPVAGVMICLYTVLQIFGVKTQRYLGTPTDDAHID